MVLLDLVPKCQLKCDYCYARDMLDHAPSEVNLDAVIEATSQLVNPGDYVVFHGFEPLMTPRSVREAIIRRLRSKRIKFGIQTNGVALKGEELQWASENLSSIGVSWDGDWPLGKHRFHSKKMSDVVWNNIVRAVESGLRIGLISVISDWTLKHRDLYFRSLERLKDIGITSIRANPAHRPLPIVDLDGLISFYKDLTRVSVDLGIQVSPLKALQEQANGIRPHDCCWHGCDPLSTRIPVILADGSVTNCIKFAPTHWHREARTRVTYLLSLPMSKGGCKGCPWWDVCHGGCPAQSDREDGYGRTRLCRVWIALREHLAANPMPDSGRRTELGPQPVKAQVGSGASSQGKEPEIET